MDQHIWNLIRETRSTRPGRAQDDDERAAVYGAALQQFEELMRAAETTGYASRPLPLFYAISQAGRAIAAAWASDVWSPSAHGVRFSLGGSPLCGTVEPNPVKKPGRIDSFASLVAARDQGTLSAKVELGALWASLPDLWRQDLRDERWRRPLVVRRKDEDATGLHRGAIVEATILFMYDRSLPKRLFDGVEDVTDEQFDSVVSAELQHYPTAEGWRFHRRQRLRLDRRTYDAWEVEVLWESASEHRDVREDEFRSHVFQHRILNQWWLRPDLNDEGDFLMPLATWWVLLFGLSMLARYYPAQWSSALRVDDSGETVPLEAVLNEALLAVPHFVLEALIGQQFTFAS
jgi:hypothetical protein